MVIKHNKNSLNAFNHLGIVTADLADFERNFANDAVSFTKELVNQIGSGTGSIVMQNLSDTKSQMLSNPQTASANDYFSLDINGANSFVNNNYYGNGVNPYTGGGATTTNRTDRGGNINPNAAGTWGGTISGNGVRGVAAGVINLQVGALEGQGMGMKRWKLSTVDLHVDDVKVDSFQNAGTGITKFDKGIEMVSDIRSYYGALQNRLEHTIQNLDNVSENTQAAESRIRDTDMAKTMVDYSKGSILQQAGQSILAQANQSMQGVLNLLQ